MANGTIEQAAPAPRAVAAAPAASGGWRFGIAARLIFYTVVFLLMTVGVMTTVGVLTENLQYAAGAGLGVVLLATIVLMMVVRRGVSAPLREMAGVYQNVGK